MSENEKFKGIPHGHFDGYDGGGIEPPPDFIADLLEHAPQAVKERADVYARERAAAEPGTAPTK